MQRGSQRGATAAASNTSSVASSSGVKLPVSLATPSSTFRALSRAQQSQRSVVVPAPPPPPSSESKENEEENNGLAAGESEDVRVPSGSPDSPNPHTDTVATYLRKLWRREERNMREHTNRQVEAVMREFQEQKKAILERAELDNALQAKKRTKVVGKRVLLERVSCVDKTAASEATTPDAWSRATKLVTVDPKPPSTSVQVIEAPTQFEISVYQKGVCKLGRSRGAAFMEGHGVSLSWDQEVSTTHGQFELAAHAETGEYNLMFTDVGSTNGTKVLRWTNGKASTIVVEGGSSIQVYVGDILMVGATRLRIVEAESPQE